MTSFASLMALSATQTRERESEVQSQLAERQRKEEEKRRKQEEQERKERENAARMRAKHFEELKKEEERKKRKEAERQALESERLRREGEQRNALLYGPKRAKSEGAAKWPSSSSQHREEVRRRRLPSEDADDDGPRSEPLTREELREKKLQAVLKRTFATAKTSTTTGGYQKPGRRLPGGAVDLTTSKPQTSAGSGAQSVKERLAAMPNTLTKLNTVKRDTRTIDEILQDRAKARELKILDGDEALAFDDWFGSHKKRDKSRPGSTAPNSGANSPKSSTPGLQGNGVSGSTSSIPSFQKKSVSVKPATTPKPTPKSSTTTRPTARPIERTDKLAGSSSKSISKSKLSVSASSRSSSMLPKKRARSSSRSESPFSKRRAVSSELDDDDDYGDGDEGDERIDVKGLIWGIMGKNRDDYVKMDVFSDDEDMEADARALEREEKFSARIAKREDLEAQEAERRHEEEKRRRKMGRA